MRCLLRSHAFAVGTIVLLFAAACAEETAQETNVVDPETALAALRALEDETEIDAQLEAWPAEHPQYVGTAANRVALTWRLGRRLQRDKLEEAVADLDALEVQFEGSGRTPAGVTLASDALRDGLARAAFELARRRRDGSEPHVEAASQALAIGLARQTTQGDPLLAATSKRWVEATTAAELWEGPPPFRIGPRPQVVVVADAFGLAQESFAGQLTRWVEEGAVRDVVVAVLPVDRPYIVVGTRRVPAADPVAARRAFVGRAQALGLRVFEAENAGDPAMQLGLADAQAAVLLLDASGRIVARLQGKGLDLQRVEGAWQKLLRL